MKSKRSLGITDVALKPCSLSPRVRTCGHIEQMHRGSLESCTVEEVYASLGH